MSTQENDTNPPVESDSSSTSNSTSRTMSEMIGETFKTPGVKNIEAAYTRAGATANHTPGTATTLGSQNEQPPHEYEMAGVGTEKFAEGVQGQRPESGMLGKVFNRMVNGTDSTK